MLSLRMRSGSWGGDVRSTISIAGEMPAIAALAVSPSASAGTSRPICTAISGSSTGFDHPANDTLPPDCTRAFCVKKPTSGAEMLKLQHRRRAETHLPAQWLVAGIKTLAPRRELRPHAPHDAGILPEFHGHSRLVGIMTAGSDG